MKSWKALLGVGAACVACCAVPLFSGTAVLSLSTLAAAGSGLLACTEDLLPKAALLLAAAAAGAGVLAWRHRSQRGQTCGCDGHAQG